MLDFRKKNSDVSSDDTSSVKSNVTKGVDPQDDESELAKSTLLDDGNSDGAAAS